MKNSLTPMAAALALTLFSGTANGAPQAGASREEQARYVNACLAEPACNSALMQIWQTNGREVGMDRYAPPEDKIPPLLRGTAMGRKMREKSAISYCAPDDRCRAFLVEATSTIRALPADALQHASQSQDNSGQPAVHSAAGQMRATVAQAIAQATAAQHGRTAAPALAVNAAALPDSEPAGVIDFARNPYTGLTMQLVKRADGNRDIERRGPDGVKRLASVMGREGKWLIQLNGGAELEASDIQLTSRGFLAGVQGQPVSYTEAGGLQKLAWPQGFHPAATQRDNVARTGYLLLERNAAPTGSVNKLLGSFKGLGAALGAGRNEDYALMDMHSGRAFPININASGKDVMQMSNCQRKNVLTNVCRDATSSERLYNAMGKNMGHYAWIIHWFQAPTGTFLIALEDGVRNLTVTRLETGEKRIAFNRTLGIADFSAEQADDGRISLSAKMAFDVKRIDDLEAAFASLAPAPAAAALAQQ